MHILQMTWYVSCLGLTLLCLLCLLGWHCMNVAAAHITHAAATPRRVLASHSMRVGMLIDSLLQGSGWTTWVN